MLKYQANYSQRSLIGLKLEAQIFVAVFEYGIFSPKLISL
jgi:hypothetical protein